MLYYCIDNTIAFPYNAAWRFDAAFVLAPGFSPVLAATLKGSVLEKLKIPVIIIFLRNEPNHD
jgi:hypothetical protein